MVESPGPDPRKLVYLRTNWMTALALLVPALRVLRFARVLRLTRARPLPWAACVSSAC